MSTQVLDRDQIGAYLEEVTQSGSARVETDGLYTRRDATAEWHWCGPVEDALEAQELVRDHFDDSRSVVPLLGDHAESA